MRRPPILSYFPGDPRSQQSDILLTVEREWANYDVFVIDGPVALGKQKIGETISAWTKNASMIVPTNQLAQQVQGSSELTGLYKASMYVCKSHDDKEFSCADYAKMTKAKGAKKGFYCKGCPYVTDLRRSKAKGVNQTGVYNYYTYLAHKLYRPTLIIDEAHDIIKVIKEMNGHKLWHHQHKYPKYYKTRSQLLEWLNKQPNNDDKRALLHACLVSDKPTHIVDKAQEWYNRVQPGELRDLIQLLPIDVRFAKPVLWPYTVQKIVLMSATINKQDIQDLGLSNRRVLYVKANSPIPKDRRPLALDYVASVNIRTFDNASKLIAKRILELANHHVGEKGFIHSTYAQSKILQEVLGDDPRFVWHTKHNTRQKLAEWMSSKPEDGKVFVGCGLYQGLDLKDDLARWQGVAKVPWGSLADIAVKYKAEQEPDWYLNQVVKDVGQAYGRVCRSPTDYGITYMLDGSFQRVLLDAEHLLPEWLKEAIVTE